MAETLAGYYVVSVVVEDRHRNETDAWQEVSGP